MTIQPLRSRVTSLTMHCEIPGQPPVEITVDVDALVEAADAMRKLDDHRNDTEETSTR